MPFEVMIGMLALSMLNSAGCVGLKVAHPIQPPLHSATTLTSENDERDNKPLPYYFTEESKEQQQGSADDGTEAATQVADGESAEVFRLRSAINYMEIQEVSSGFWATAHLSSSAARVERAKPLFWLHVPKQGSSFEEAILHQESFCPAFPLDKHLEEGVGNQQNLMGEFLTSGHYCPGVFVESLLSHLRLPSPNSMWKGAAVTMIRQPMQHLYSLAYQKLDCLDDDCVVRSVSSSGACQLTTLSREACAVDTPANLADFRKGKEILQSKFAFVGIVEEWQLSICLFHAIFGGPVHAFEFGNTPLGTLGKEEDQTGYNTTSIDHIMPEAVLLFYAFAQNRFEIDLQRYLVDAEKCMAIV